MNDSFCIFKIKKQQHLMHRGDGYEIHKIEENVKLAIKGLAIPE